MGIVIGIIRALINWAVRASNSVLDPPPLLHKYPEPLEPWAMSYNRNLERSRLCGLPLELVPLVAQHLPPDGIYLLRQTSRHFRGILPVAERGAAQGPLRRQIYCSPCRGLRGDANALQRARKKLQQRLWCSGCSQKHPAVFFSAGQRDIPDYNRTCIGREGHMRICAHLTLYWSWLESANKSFGEAKFSCNDESHGGEAVKVDIKNSGKGSEVTVRASWAVFESTSRVTNMKNLSAGDILRSFHTYVREHDVSLCPHGGVGDDASPRRQMRLFPTIKTDDCYVNRTSTEETCNSRSPLVLSGDTAVSQGACCPLCLLSPAHTITETFDHAFYAVHYDRCAICKATYTWRWSNFIYGMTKSCKLGLDMSRQAERLEKPTDVEWLRSLDITGPADPRGDADTKHLLWCDDGNCATSLSWADVRDWAGDPNTRA